MLQLGRAMKIPFEINDDIIISNNDKDNDVSNGCLRNTALAVVETAQVAAGMARLSYEQKQGAVHKYRYPFWPF